MTAMWGPAAKDNRDVAASLWLSGSHGHGYQISSHDEDATGVAYLHLFAAPPQPMSPEFPGYCTQPMQYLRRDGGEGAGTGGGSVGKGWER